MASRNRTHRSLLLVVLALVVFAGACSQSNTPETWGEAEEDGTLRENFIRACLEANEDGGEQQFSETQANTYCTCSFEEIVEYFGGEIGPDNRISDVANAVEGRDFEAFKDLESDLRGDPESIPIDIQRMLEGCAAAAS